MDVMDAEVARIGSSAGGEALEPHPVGFLGSVGFRGHPRRYLQYMQ